MGDRIDPGDVLADEGARLSDWLGGLLTRGLTLPEGLTVDQHARETAGARAAVSGLAGEVWDAAGTGIVERIQAAQFVCAHAAAMDWQAEANRRDLPPHARQTCQRLARQLMALTTAQLGGLCRLKAERRRERAEAARLAGQAARRAERRTAAEAKAWIADRRALVADLEETLKDDPGLDEMADLALALAAPPPGTAPGAYGAAAPGEEPLDPPRPAKPEPVGAGVPEPPPTPAPPLNRQQRRALERLRRKKRRRERVG